MPNGRSCLNVFAHVSPGFTSCPGSSGVSWFVPGSPPAEVPVPASASPKAPPEDRMRPSRSTFMVKLVAAAGICEAGSAFPFTVAWKSLIVTPTVATPLGSTASTFQSIVAARLSFTGMVWPPATAEPWMLKLKWYA